jgi:hypothetical protein
VVLADVWDAFHAAEDDLDSLALRCGWPLEAVRTMEAYRGVPARYSFPALPELRELFLDAGFSLADVFHPTYELGDRCPTLLLDTGAPARRA